MSHPPFITIFMGGIPTIKNGWFMTLLYQQYTDCVEILTGDVARGGQCHPFYAEVSLPSVSSGIPWP